MNLPRDIEGLSPETLTLITEALPDSLEPILKVLGLSLTLALVEGFAGQDMVFPKNSHGPGADKFATIAEFIGFQPTVVLGQALGGERLYIPKCDHLRRVWRRVEMIHDYDMLLKVTGAGKATRELCSRYSLSYRQVDNIVNGKLEARNQYRQGAKRPIQSLPSNRATA